MWEKLLLKDMERLLVGSPKDWTLPYMALFEALKTGKIEDPKETAKHLLQTYEQVIIPALKNIPGREKLTKDDHREAGNVVHPGWVMYYVSAALERYAIKIMNKDRKKYEELKRYADALKKLSDDIDNNLEAIQRNPERLKDYIARVWWELTEEPFPHPEEEEEEEEEEDTTGARELLKIALRETLPGWALKQGLDQAKAPLYTGPEGVHPYYVKYHIERTSPDSPLGTLLHPIVTRIISEWEREAREGKQPSHPYDILRRLIGDTLSKEKLTEEEAKRIALRLGLSRTIPPPALKRVLEEVLRDLKQLKEGEVSPHRLDAEKEAALRYYQLRGMAHGTPSIDPTETLTKNIDTVIEAFNNIKTGALQEVQLGRQDLEKALASLEQRLPVLLRELGERLRRGERVSSVVAEQTERLSRELEGEIGDRFLRSWTVNLARNILLDAPIIATIRDPTIQWKPLKEKQRIAAALMKLYEEEGKKHHIAPITPDLHGMWEQVKEKKGEEALTEIEKIRARVNAVGNAALIAQNTFRGILEATNFNEKGVLNHEVIGHLAEAKKRVLEATFPRIIETRKREEK